MISLASAVVLLGLAQGTGAEPVALRLGACVPAPDLVFDLVGLEIAPRRLEGGAALTVHADCISEERLHLRVVPAVASLGGRDLPRRSLAGEEGARLVALSIAELLADRDAALHAEGRSPVRVGQGAPLAPPPPPSRLHLALSPALRWQSGPSRVAIGARGRGYLLTRAAGLPLALELAVGLEESRVEVGPGEVRSRVATVLVGAGQHLELSPQLGLLATGGLAGGLIWLHGQVASGEMATGRAASGPWLGAQIAVHLRYGGGAGLCVGLEAGWTLREIYGQVPGEAPVGQRGGWIGLELGLDWRLGT